MRRAEAGKRRDKICPARVRHGFRQNIDLPCAGNQPEIVPEPFDGTARVEDAALQRILHTLADAPGDGGEQPVLTLDGSCSRVHH
ncbi:hypothetical protein SDC9_161778 [bioreactor metagenome]|uniref:Uncharacterized protein n=1 Tax=bioreactor metagenome TaxID=1076179 RepID=A0A645FJ85_9ZZZZ